MNRELFEWHGFKFFLVILAHFIFLELWEIDELAAKISLQFIGFVFLYLLFAPPVTTYRAYEGDNPLVSWLDAVERIILQVNEIMFQAFTFKLIIAVIYMAGFTSLIDIDNRIWDFMMYMVIYFVTFLLFMKPKDSN